MSRNPDPEPGQTISLADGSPDTRVRQVLSSDPHLDIHEVRDDRGMIVFIREGEAPGLWIQLLEV
jgi:hypothetical protein